MKDLNQNITIVQESTHVNSIEAIVQQRLLSCIWQVKNFRKCLKPVLSIYIVKSVRSFELERSLDVLTLIIIVNLCILKKILCLKNSFWVRIVFVEVINFTFENGILIFYQTYVIVLRFQLNLLDFLEAKFFDAIQGTVALTSISLQMMHKVVAVQQVKSFSTAIESQDLDFFKIVNAFVIPLVRILWSSFHYTAHSIYIRYVVNVPDLPLNHWNLFISKFNFLRPKINIH